MNFIKLNYISLVSILINLVFVTSAISANINSEVDFEKMILPIFQNRCFSCHSAPKIDVSGNMVNPKAGVQLDSVNGIKESRHGEVIIAGAPDDSLLFQRIMLQEGETGIMPPTEEGDPLTEQEITLIEQWIKQGANFGDWTGKQSQQKITNTNNNSHQTTIMPPITSLVFSPDGKSLIASSQAGLLIYEYPSLKQSRLVKTHAHHIHDVAFSPSGDKLAVGGGNPAIEGVVEIFSWQEGKSLRVLKQHHDSVMSVVWQNALSLASGGMDRRIILWDLRTGTSIQDLKGHSKGVSSLCFLNEKNILVSTGIDQSVRVWDLTSGGLIRSMNNHTLTVNDLALRPGNAELPILVSAGEDKTVRFWQPTIGRMVKFARLKRSPMDISWMNNGTQVVAACEDGSVRIIDLDTVEVSAEIQVLSGWAYALAVHPTDGSIAIGGVNGQVRRIIPKQPILKE